MIYKSNLHFYNRLFEEIFSRVHFLSFLELCRLKWTKCETPPEKPGNSSESCRHYTLPVLKASDTFGRKYFENKQWKFYQLLLLTLYQKMDFVKLNFLLIFPTPLSLLLSLSLSFNHSRGFFDVSFEQSCWRWWNCSSGSNTSTSLVSKSSSTLEFVYRAFT